MERVMGREAGRDRQGEREMGKELLGETETGE